MYPEIYRSIDLLSRDVCMYLRKCPALLEILSCFVRNRLIRLEFGTKTCFSGSESSQRSRIPVHTTSPYHFFFKNCSFSYLIVLHSSATYPSSSASGTEASTIAISSVDGILPSTSSCNTSNLSTVPRLALETSDITAPIRASGTLISTDMIGSSSSTEAYSKIMVQVPCAYAALFAPLMYTPVVGLSGPLEQPQHGHMPPTTYLHTDR